VITVPELATRTADAGAGRELPEPAVLLVEDDAGDAMLVEELLADSGVKARLRWVRSLGEARRALAGETPQCVLLDLHLPDAHGFSALETVLAAAGGAAVVVLTGLAEEEAGLAAVAAGAQDYLVKGRVEAEWLGRAIRYAIQRKQAEHTAAELRAGQLRAQENARLERGLLPVPLLRSAPVRVTARYRPGRASALLGGDFYDVVEADDGTVHAVIGDVCGHGPDEAALGVCLRIAWRTLILSGVSGPELLRNMHRILVAERTSPEVFATVSMVSLNPDRRSVRVLRAGHPGLLMRSPATVELVETPHGPALGLPEPMGNWRDSELRLPAGGALVLFTDGLFERRLREGSGWMNENGLATLARRRRDLPGPQFVDALITDVEEVTRTGASADDLAVVHLQWDQR
jgi:serine phosphatase RsbU (regulator of sigma subunit)